MRKIELERYRNKLLDRRKGLLGDINKMSEESVSKRNSDLSSMPIHMADIGSDNYEQDVTLNLLEGEHEELRAIDLAVGRITEGNYGMCDDCGKKIPKARLDAIPYAGLCVKCKREKELEEFGGE